MGVGHGGSPAAKATVTVSAVEQLIGSLPGVEGVRILVDPEGGLGEVHVLADSSRNPKSIVRDIESGLAARWGLAVDHRRISVAQMEDAPTHPVQGRLRLQQLAVTNDPIRGWLEVAVSLTPELSRDAFGRPQGPGRPTTIWQGRAAGANSHLGMRLAAEATLQALNQSLLPNHSFALGEVARSNLGEQEILLCLLRYHAPRGAGDTLCGSALIRTEPIEAAVRAVLNASNRVYGVAARRGQSPDVPAESEAFLTGAVGFGAAEAAVGREAAGVGP